MSSQGSLLESLVEPYLERRSLYLVTGPLAQERRYLLRFLSFLGRHGVVEVQDISEELVAAYREELQGSPNPKGGGYSVSFFQQALLCVRHFLVWAHQRQLIFWDLSDFDIPKRDDEPPTVPTVDEMKRLLELPDVGCPLGKRDRLLLELLYVLGLRTIECVRLDLQHADLKGRTLTITGKAGHERLLPLSRGILETLWDYISEGRPKLSPSSGEKALLVSGTRQRRLQGVSLAVRVRQYGAKIGLKLSPHQLRHACGTHLIEGGAKLCDVATLLGHQRLEATQRYTRVSSLELARLHRRCHPRAVLQGSPS